MPTFSPTDRARRLVPALLAVPVFRRLCAVVLTQVRRLAPTNGLEPGRSAVPRIESHASATGMPSAVVPADHAGILHALLDASPLAVIGLAADGTVRLWSPAAERLFGWKEEHVLGRQDPLAPGPLAGEARRLLDRALAGEPVSGVEVVRQTLDGALVTVNVWAMLVGLPAPTTVRVLFLYQDVTERKRTEQQLVRQREALHRNEKLADLGRLAAGVAHELRNPLAVIDTRVQLLERLLARGGVGTESLAHHVGYLEEAAARMKRIVEGLSSYARPSRVEPAVLDVREVLVATRELLRAEARGQGTEIVLEVPERRVPVLGDRSRLMQILINLGTNALEAMSEHPGRLVLRACLESADDADRVVVEVSDTGPGIPPDRLESIWEPFFTTKAEGTGLGLSIVRSLIAEQPGAVLTMQSALDRGTTFRLSLLAAPPPASREERLA